MHEIKIAIMTDNGKLCSGNSIDDATDTNSSGHSSLLPLQPRVDSFNKNSGNWGAKSL